MGDGFTSETFTGNGRAGRRIIDASASDFRSDTVTRPTPAMREAMATAEVGDDVYGDDPTVNRLEALAAERTGHEAALFVPSGTMGNQIALRYATRPGDEAIVEERSHMILYEVGAAGMLSGVQLRTVPSRAGVLDLDAVGRALRDPRDLHQPRTTFLAIENTHNLAGGTVVPIEHLRELASWCREQEVHFHMDGARLFNAAAASGLPAAEIASIPTSVMFCLSKGLGAPIGSILASDSETIRECRRIRKAFGGGMRQAGIVAAAAILALEDPIDRLLEDHRRARELAEGFAAIDGIEVDQDAVQTNMVYVALDGGRDVAERLESRLAESGVLAVALGDGMLRFVTHSDLRDEDVGRAIEAVRDEAARLGAGSA